MHTNKIISIPAAVLAFGLLTSAAYSQSLLGVVGGSDSGALVTIGSGDAGDSGAVNVGLGGGGGNVVDANVLPSGGGNLVDANVSSGGSNGVLDIDANIGRTLDANVNVGGPGLLGVDVSIGGGGPGGPGGPGSPGSPGSPGTNGGGAGPGFLGGSGGGSAVGSVNGGCVGLDPNRAVALFEQSTMSGWNRASAIEIVPVGLCPDARRQVANYLAASGRAGMLQGLVINDGLVSAALSRTSYGVDRVLGVNRSGSRLTVYVF